MVSIHVRDLRSGFQAKVSTKAIADHFGPYMMEDGFVLRHAISRDSYLESLVLT